MRRAPVLLATVGLIAGLAGPASPAAAAAPHLALHNDRPSIAADGHPRFSFRADDLRSDSQVVLQVRDPGRWTTVLRSKRVSGDARGSFTPPAPGELGSYRFRALVVRHGSSVVVSDTKTVHAYGAVSMRALCHGVLDGDCEDGSVTLSGGREFRYVLDTGIDETDDPWTAQLGAPATSCRRVHFTFISDSPDHTRTYLELRQPGRKAQRHVGSSSTVGSFTAALSGGRFGMSVEQDAAQVFMYFNGRASCYTAGGRR